MSEVNKTPESVQQIFNNYEKRRSGILKALTTDVDDFYAQCDPDRENLCLFGQSDGTWVVDTPADEVPPELPEPCLGINFARDGMRKSDWISLVAVHADAWLIGVAFYYGILLTKDERKQLFMKINSLPTLYQEVTGKSKSGPKRKREATDNDTAVQSDRKGTLTAADLTTHLKGRKAELFWPDDGNWYKVEITKINTKSHQATIQYNTGESEELDLDEIIKAGHMVLL